MCSLLSVDFASSESGDSENEQSASKNVKQDGVSGAYMRSRKGFFGVKMDKDAHYFGGYAA